MLVLLSACSTPPVPVTLEPEPAPTFEYTHIRVGSGCVMAESAGSPALPPPVLLSQNPAAFASQCVAGLQAHHLTDALDYFGAQRWELVQADGNDAYLRRRR